MIMVHTIKLKSEWCVCSAGKSDTGKFFDDMQCTCGIKRHHYHCNKCGKVTQVG
jgi:Fe2+ or Zn2+ uptake regulation protein